MSWIGLGIVLTILDSWNNEWDWMTLNILSSLAFIRLTRPYVLSLLQKCGWLAFVLIVCALLAMLPVAGDIVDYGSEGWLWGLFGLCQRMYVNERFSSSGNGKDQQLAPTAHGLTQNWALVRLLACFIAAVVYVWQEQLEFWFSQPQFATFCVCLGVLAIGLCCFTPGPSRFQPPRPMADALCFMGRHTLEIYAIQLAGSELIIGIFPATKITIVETTNAEATKTLQKRRLLLCLQ